MRTKTKLTVGLFEGEKQAIEAASMAWGLSMSEFTRIVAYEAAQKVMAEKRVIEAEVVDAVSVPNLPDVPQATRFSKAEKAMQTRFKARRLVRG